MIGGREVSGVRLRFEAGKVVDASAERGEEYLLKLLDTDDGARRLGELGIGTNYGIDRGTREVLLDEKIGGTVHMAVGTSYPESGGVNESAVHTDLVCDLRLGGKLEVDGVVMQEDGRSSSEPLRSAMDVGDRRGEATTDATTLGSSIIVGARRSTMLRSIVRCMRCRSPSSHGRRIPVRISRRIARNSVSHLLEAARRPGGSGRPAARRSTLLSSASMMAA